MKEESGSSAYVPQEPEKDKQLQYAISLLLGKVAASTDTPAASQEKVPN